MRSCCRKGLTGRVASLCQASWQDQSCGRWGLSGDRKDRGRRIYYAFSVAYEMDILKVVLEEIYPVVDVIILQESRHTWGMGFAQEKPMYFRQLHQKHFAKYLDKIRYQEYNFSAVTHCTPEYVGGIPTTVSKECRWHQQWHARNSLELGAHDIRPQDVFVVADLDELLSREFLAALKHCEVHPEMEQPGGGCSKVVALTFGHKYTFDCTAQRPAGHFHPDITMGKCVFFFGPEELRMNYGSDWTQPHKLEYASLYRPQDIRGTPYLEGMREVERVGAIKHRVVGPVGWHLMSFLSPYQLLYKQYLRSGPSAPDLGNRLFTDGWKDSDIAALRTRMARCDDRADVFSIDAWGCMPLPHIVREEPEKWRHFIELVPDEEYPDDYGLLTDIRAFLDTRHA